MKDEIIKILNSYITNFDSMDGCASFCGIDFTNIGDIADEIMELIKGSDYKNASR